MGIENLIERHKYSMLRAGFISDEFLDFIKKNKEPYDTLISYYKCAMMEVETKFRVLNEQFSLEYDRNPIESIKTRIKSTDSLIRKIRDKNIPLTMTAIENNINDIAGVRIICSFLDDIYTLADCLINQDDITLIKIKDYVKNPKDNGYRSLHLIIDVPIVISEGTLHLPVEIQLRTIAMDMWASLEHELRYKSDRNFSDSDAPRLRLCSEAISEIDREMQDIYQGKEPSYHE